MRAWPLRCKLDLRPARRGRRDRDESLDLWGGRPGSRTWLAIDLGVSFASEEHLPGVDLIFPDIRYLVEERKNLLAIVLTHAHEDHFGALFDLWPRLKVPVYATPFTAALIEAKRQSEPGAPDIAIKVVPLGARFTLGPFDIEFVSVAHSIPESNALILRTRHGTVLHTGDWKLDPTPVIGLPTDEAKLRALGDEGVLALVGDSTNAVREGPVPSETDVARTLTELVAKARGRVAITTFASNVARLAPRPSPRRRPVGRSSLSAAPWSASCRSPGKPAISRACRISAA